MKRSWMEAGVVMVALLALAVGPQAAAGAGAPAKRLHGPGGGVRGRCASVGAGRGAGQAPRGAARCVPAGRAARPDRGERAGALELQRKVLEMQLERLDAAYRAGELPELRYQSLKARLQARKLALEGPSLAELVARSGGDVEVLKAQLRTLEEARLDRLLDLGMISSQQAERLRANLDVRARRLLNRPAGLNPAAGFGAPQSPGARGHGFQKPRRPHGPQEHPARPGAGPRRPGR